MTQMINVMFSCLLDKCEHSIIPEYQSHSFNETTAASGDGTTFSKISFSSVLMLTFANMDFVVLLLFYSL